MRTETHQFSVPERAERVWEFLADYRNDMRWRTEMRECRLVSGAPGQVGSVYHGLVAWEGLSTEFDVECVAARPYDHLSYRSPVDYASTVSSYDLQEQADGTLVTVSFSLDMAGALIVLEPFAWGILSRWARSAEQRLPEVLGGLRA